MSEVAIGVVALCALLALFITGIEMGFAMAIVGFVGYVVLVSMKGAMTMLAIDFYETFSSYSYTVIPLFVLMGQVSLNSGIANRLYTSANRFLGHIPGGLALATVAGATGFKTICGSGAATSATFASVAVPEMDRFSYSKQLSTGIVAVAGTLGVLLPPSVILIIFGMVTEQSIGRLFLAGLLPGLLLAALFAVVIIVWCRRNPEVGPPTVQHTWRDKISSLPAVGWPLAIFVLVLGGLLGGLFTPTEAGSVGTLAVILLTLFKRDIHFKDLLKSIAESLRTACMVLTLIASSTVLGHFIAVTNIPSLTADWVTSLDVHRHIIMIVVFVIYLIGGSVIDDLAFLILATPIFYPAIIKLGYDPLWAGIMICLTVVVGGVIPPVAMNVFIVKSITKVPISTIYKGVYPFLISMVVLIVLIFLFPGIVLFLPQKLMK